MAKKYSTDERFIRKRNTTYLQNPYFKLGNFCLRGKGDAKGSHWQTPSWSQVPWPLHVVASLQKAISLSEEKEQLSVGILLKQLDH